MSVLVFALFRPLSLTLIGSFQWLCCEVVPALFHYWNLSRPGKTPSSWWAWNHYSSQTIDQWKVSLTFIWFQPGSTDSFKLKILNVWILDPKLLIIINSSITTTTTISSFFQEFRNWEPPNFNNNFRNMFVPWWNFFSLNIFNIIKGSSV